MAELTAAQQKLVELDKKKTELDKFYDEYDAAVKAVADESGLGSFFQDADGTVYKTEVPAGRFIHYKQLAVVRTRREGEKAGSLSLKAAQEAGYSVK